MQPKFRLVSVLTALVIISLLVSSGAQAGTSRAGQGDAPNAQKGAVISKTISPAQQRAALAYWTRERVAAAQPVKLPAFSGAPEQKTETAPAPEPGGVPGFSPPGAAASGADKIARQAYPEAWRAPASENGAFAAEEANEVGGTSQVFTSYKVPLAMHRWYPHRSVGRLNFTTSAGATYCTATVLSGNVIVTAAHCLFDTVNNRFYYTWVFAPAYRNGSAPYGWFPAQVCWVLATWADLAPPFSFNLWTPQDVGVCRMGNNSAGQTLNGAVGWMGRQWNYPSYAQHFYTIGYASRNSSSAALPGAGQIQRLCAAEGFQQAWEIRGVGCNFGAGMDGGPLLVGYAPQVVSGAVDGVAASFFSGIANIYAPRFNSSNIVPLCYSAGC